MSRQKPVAMTFMATTLVAATYFGSWAAMGERRLVSRMAEEVRAGASGDLVVDIQSWRSVEPSISGRLVAELRSRGITVRELADLPPDRSTVLDVRPDGRELREFRDVQLLTIGAVGRNPFRLTVRIGLSSAPSQGEVYEYYYTWGCGGWIETKAASVSIL